MIPIPKYLEDLSKLKKSTNDYIEVTISCSCGGNKFAFYENYIEKTQEEIDYEKELEAFNKRHFFSYEWGTLKDGKSYLYKSHLFGLLITDKVEIKHFDNTQIIKVKCLECNKEYVLFDSRFNGYDSIMSTEEEKKIKYTFKEKKFKKAKNIIKNVTIKIYNDPSIEDFKGSTGEYDITEEEYSNQFGWIGIYGEDINGTKKEIFSIETQ